MVMNRQHDFDIGLNLKMFKRRLLISGYCMATVTPAQGQGGRKKKKKRKMGRGSHGQERERVDVKLGTAALELIRAYHAKFPEVFSVRCKQFAKQ